MDKAMLRIVAICFFIAAITANIELMAQQRPVTGTVLDTEGLPLIGATVVKKGTSVGTITDSNGEFSMQANSSDILVVSYIGYLSNEIRVEGKTDIRIVLVQDANELSEVVVVGYGVTQKEDLTGSISVISSEDFETQPMNRVENILQARAPGVVVNQTSGAPGAGMKVRIRGSNSFSGNNSPLYVIDGFLGASINAIDPNDIESISILKDASGTALYGSRGANGVIIITTKSGKKGAEALRVNYSHGISQVRKKYDLLEGYEYMMLMNEKNQAESGSDVWTRREILEAQSVGGTNWQNEIFQLGQEDKVQMNVTSGDFVFSGGFLRNTGIVKGSTYSRYNLRMKYEKEFFKFVKFNVNVSNSLLDSRNLGGGRFSSIVQSAIGWAPNVPIYSDLTGDYTKNPYYGPLNSNPMFTINEDKDQTYRDVFNVNSFLEFTLMEGLKLKTQGIVNLNGASSRGFSRVSPNKFATEPTMSSYSNSHNINFDWQTTNQLSYLKNIENHNIDAIAFFEASEGHNQWFNANGNDMITTSGGYFSSGASEYRDNGSGRNKESMYSFGTRFNYNYARKYYATASIRRDYSSRLAEGHEDATFPSFALAYRISNEDFFNVPAIDDLKIRYSYGKVGSKGVGIYSTISNIGFSSGYPLSGTSNTRGVSLPRPVNPELTWEITTQNDIGIDMRFFKGRLEAMFDYFIKETNGLHFNKSVPIYFGGGSITRNLGVMENKGFEVSLSGYPIDRNGFSLYTSANFTKINNKIIELDGEESLLSGLNPNDNKDMITNSHINYIGQPMGLLYGFIFDGVYGLDEADEAAIYGRSPGDAKYVDVNEDGLLNGDDFDVIGNPNPDFTWGLSSTLRYKRLDFNVGLQGVHGVDVFNSSKYDIYGGGSVKNATSREFYENHWSLENQDTDIPGFSPTSVMERQSSQWVEDGSFIKVRNLTLSYTLLTENQSAVKSLKLHCTAQNMFVITNYSGYDPETWSSSGDKGAGVDDGTYPVPRTLVVGINVTF